VTDDLALSLAIALIAAPAIGAFLLWLSRRQRKRREARLAMAARRGWGIAETTGEGGRGSRITLTGDEGGGWRCTAMHLPPRSGGHSGTEWTEWETAGRHSPAGLWVAGPPLAPGEGEGAAAMLGALDCGLGRMLLRQMIGDAAELATGLVHLPRPGGRERPFTLLATAPADAASPDLDALSELLAAWRAGRRDAALHPVVIAEPGRLRLRLGRALVEAAEIERYADTALAIAALFPGGEGRSIRPGGRG
jgi:hypothetical protein